MKAEGCLSRSGAVGAREPGVFEPREATVKSVHDAIFSGRVSCRDVVAAFLARIEAMNSRINAIVALDPEALDDAARLDRDVAAGTASGILFGVPVLLKDNFDTTDLPTTGGCVALVDNRPQFDAPVVAMLRGAGAVILGKTNLHEFALEGLTASSLGGQTVNPYDSSRTPGGSSGGTGAAIAASFAVLGTGTDTVNSLRSPASANSLFSFRPTRGLITRQGIMPVSTTQDTVGPIARTAEDLAIALTVMAGVGWDPTDEATNDVPKEVRRMDYVGPLQDVRLEGLRFGLLEGFLDRSGSPETAPVNDALDGMISSLRAAGVTVVSIEDPVYDAQDLLKMNTQNFEFRENMDKYLARPSLRGDHPTSFREIYSTPASPNDARFLVIPSQYPAIHAALTSSTSDAAYYVNRRTLSDLSRTLAATFASHDLDALIYPQQRNLVVPLSSPSQHGRNGILAALTGSPVVTVPAGFSGPTSTAPLGVPIGVEILGRKWEEAKLLGIAWAIEQLGQVRRAPVWADEVVEVEERHRRVIPVVTPERGNLPDAYPLGCLGEYQVDKIKSVHTPSISCGYML